MVKSKSILIIEDDPDLADMYMLQLTGVGYRVMTAPSAQAALDVLDKQSIDLILLDVLLPNSNGFAILHELRSYPDWRDIPVVMLSNVTLAEVGVSKGLLKELGVYAYLEKPKAKAGVLAATVKKALTNAKP